MLPRRWGMRCARARMRTRRSKPRRPSKWGQGPQPPKLLEDPVTIPTSGSPVRGPAGAVLTLVEFSDFQCPYCSIAVAKLDAVLAAYPGKVKLIFKQFPLRHAFAGRAGSRRSHRSTSAGEVLAHA